MTLSQTYKISLLQEVQIVGGNSVSQIKRQITIYHPFGLVGERPDTEKLLRFLSHGATWGWGFSALSITPVLSEDDLKSQACGATAALEVRLDERRFSILGTHVRLFGWE